MGYSVRILDRILDGSPERHVIERGKRIIDHAVAENNMLPEILSGSGDIEKFRKIENLADKEVFDISSSITSGAIAPNIMEDMLRFINLEDDIVDTIFNLSRAILRYKGRNKKIDKYVKDNVMKLTVLINKALILLYEMHKAETLDRVNKLRAKIQEVEQDGDEIKDAMLDYAYKSKGMDFRAFYYVQDIAYLSDDVLDGCEDASDMIVSMMRSILT
ncbi:MAG: DUF47 family protein [Candidatus Micrarchaeota archaeon]|nr:DUF47 family protein [Candidatus Micrarchaeota archaeon]MDE1859822.1 DUF47 family protein [Candidatus Micrarchaeota archaeon]